MWNRWTVIYHEHDEKKWLGIIVYIIITEKERERAFTKQNIPVRRIGISRIKKELQ